MKITGLVSFVIEKVLTKLPLALLVMFWGIYFFFPVIARDVSVILGSIVLTDSNISSIITVSSVFIGFFATIMTMFASSQTESMNRLMETNKVDVFLRYAKAALVSSNSVMIVALVKDLFLGVHFLVLTFSCLILYFLLSSFRFSYICIGMLSFSINEVKKNQEVQRNKRLDELRKRKENDA